MEEVRGWVYLTQAGETTSQKGRSRLSPGDVVPPGYVVDVSPNSRLLLSLGPAAKLGLDSGTRLGVLTVGFEPETFVYRLDGDLLRGTMWVDVSSLGGLRKVKLVIDGAQIFLNQRLVSFRITPDGRLAVTPLSDSISLTDRDGRRIPRISPGERWVSSGPDSTGGRIAVENEWQRDLRIWNDWDAWQPEVVEMTWDPVYPPLQPQLVFERVAPIFPWKVPVDSSLIVPPETRSLAEIMSAYLDGIQAYHRDVGNYPSSSEWIESLVRDPGVEGWKGPYVPADLPTVDLWGRPLIYEVFDDGDQTYIDVRSRGPDGEDDRGLDDDIRLGRAE